MKKYKVSRQYGLASWVLVITTVLLAAAGISYRFMEPRVGTPGVVRLPVALKNFPFELGSWKGKDIPLSDAEKRVAGNDDYICRQYIDKKRGLNAAIYIAYTGNPRMMLGHNPSVCYPNSGWVSKDAHSTNIRNISGRNIPYVIYRFKRPAPQIEEVVVVNYYILNGKLTSSEEEFDSLGFRRPNIDGSHARYVTRIQISSNLESTVRIVVKEFSEEIMNYFPDENGIVRAKDILKVSHSCPN